MGYELDPLHSYIYLSNRSYKNNFKYLIHLRVTLPLFSRPGTAHYIPILNTGILSVPGNISYMTGRPPEPHFWTASVGCISLSRGAKCSDA